MNRNILIILIVVVAMGASLVFVALADDPDRSRGGFLGIYPGEVTSDMAEGYGVKAGEGVVVEGVTPGSPAAAVELRENDIITRINGQAVTGPAELRKQLRSLSKGDSVALEYYRGGKMRTATVKLEGVEEERSFSWGPFNRGDRQRIHVESTPDWEWNWKEDADLPAKKTAYAGVVTDRLTDGLAKYFKVEQGVLISEVEKDSPADKAGLKAGDVITTIAGSKVEDPGDVRKAIQDQEPGKSVDFVVSRDGKPMTVKVTLGEHEWRPFGFHYERGDSGDIPSVEVIPDPEEWQRMSEELRAELDRVKIEIDGQKLDLEKDLKPYIDGLRMKIENIEPLQDGRPIKVEVRRSEARV